ncbi:sigma-70 family RNA polymerase sigma factor [Planomonospora corallina]|uniref:Sigma-70 family RNA polymerase sigma factor n=1 Tax=Planomonospora corallina TaxID=1806052 RepID=A0ABV8I254_9ACTN
MNRSYDTATVAAARSGDPQALAVLIKDHLPLVYNVVGRAMNGHHDVDDVVQETMLRAVAGLPRLADPAAFRSWLVSIAMRQVYDRRIAWQAMPAAGLDEVPEPADPGADFVGLTILRLGLSGQRREVVEATRWLEAEDRELLSVWWLEVAGELTRAELAAGLGIEERHAAVRLQRMRERLDATRMVVRALSSARCAGLETIARGWNGRPAPLWRKRFTRHAQECVVCSAEREGLVPLDRLLGGLVLLPLPLGISADSLLAACAQVLRDASAQAAPAAQPNPPGAVEAGPTSSGAAASSASSGALTASVGRAAQVGRGHRAGRAGGRGRRAVDLAAQATAKPILLAVAGTVVALGGVTAVYAVQADPVASSGPVYRAAAETATPAPAATSGVPEPEAGPEPFEAPSADLPEDFSPSPQAEPRRGGTSPRAKSTGRPRNAKEQEKVFPGESGTVTGPLTTAEPSTQAGPSTEAEPTRAARSARSSAAPRDLRAARPSGPAPTSSAANPSTPAAEPSAPAAKPGTGTPSPAASSAKPSPPASAPAKPAPSPTKSAPAKPAPSPEKSAPVQGDRDAEFRALEDEVVRLTNVARADAGCGPLRNDEKLRQAARGHSTDMAVRGYFDHTSADGRSPWDRIRAAGYDSPAAENIAAGQSTAAAVVNSWLNSPGHRANMLNCSYKAIGAGVYYKAGGTRYWTQNFGRK